MPVPRRLVRPLLLSALLPVLAGLASAAVAGTARVAALGGGGDYLCDERNVLRWYAAAEDHAGLAVVDPGRVDLGDDASWSGRDDGPAAGVHVRPGDGRWGGFAVYLHADAPASAPSEVDNSYEGGAFSLVWARHFGGVGLGLGFRGTSYSDFRDSADEPLHGREDYRHDFGLGLRTALGRGVTLEAAGEVRQVIARTWDPDRGIHEIGPGSTRSYGLRLRLRVPAGARTELVPLVDVSRSDHPLYSDQLQDDAQLDGWLVRGGFAVLGRVRPGALVVFSVELRDGREHLDGAGSPGSRWDAVRHDWWSVLVRVGYEAPVLPWLTLRTSLQYHRVDREEARFSLSAPPYDYLALGQVRVLAPLGLGATVRAAGLNLDLAYNDHAPTSLGATPDADVIREDARFATVNLRYVF